MKKVLTLALGLVLAFAAIGSAQTPSDADTVWLTIEGDEGAPGVKDGSFVVHIWVTVGMGLSGGTLGFRWDDTNNWRVDSGVYGPVTAAWEIKAPVPIDTAIANAEGAALIGGAAIAGTTAPGPGQLYGSIYFSEKAGSTWGAGSTMGIDSSFVPPAGDFILIQTDNSSIIPTFLGAILVTFNDADDGVVDAALPSDFELAQNYPNPFNPETKINFATPTRGEVKLEVYNILGQKVKTLINGEVDAGYHQNVTWRGDNDAGAQVSSGVYFYKLTAGDVVLTRKMMLMK